MREGFCKIRRGEAFVAKGIGAGFSSVGEGGANNFDESGFMGPKCAASVLRRARPVGVVSSRAGPEL